jgi:hemolysin D
MLLAMKKKTIAVVGREVRLTPGMEVRAEIKTGERRLIEYFLAPLLRHGKESLRER